jgi:hypothetical protein
VSRPGGVSSRAPLRSCSCLRLGLSVVLLLVAGSASADRYTWQLDLDAGQVPNGLSTSSGLGQAWLDYNTDTDHLSVLVAWAGLEGDLSAIHLHGPAGPGESTRTHVLDVFSDATAIPAGLDLRSDHYSGLFHLGQAHGDDDVPHGGGHLPLEQALEAMLAGQVYVMFHSEAYLDGELRGQLPEATRVPEPGTGCLAALGVAGAFLAGRRRAIATT